MSTTDDATDDVPHPRYSPSNRKSHPSQQEVADAWADGEYPTHNADASGEAVLYTGTPLTHRTHNGPDGTNTNFYGVQSPDGTGVLWHYATREAIRTENGLILQNHQCWSTGFAHCSHPDYDAVVPLSAVESFLDDGDDVFGITEVINQPEEVEGYHGDTRTRHRARDSIVVHESGYGVAIGYDQSATDSDGHFAFRLPEWEVDRARDVGVSTAISDALTPDAVDTSDLSVVDSAEFSKTRLDDRELAAHERAGGQTSEIERGWLDNYRANRQMFRADLQGNVIVRQGDVFFIPRPDADPDLAGANYATEKMGNHRAQRFNGAVSPLPDACPHCSGSPDGTFRFDMESSGDVSCRDCGADVPRPVYARGLIRHTSNDHNAVNLGETWHEVITHDRDVLTYDDHPATGTRSGGWD